MGQLGSIATKLAIAKTTDRGSGFQEFFIGTALNNWGGERG